MKKYLLSSLLWLFILFGAFTNAGFQSNSEICNYSVECSYNPWFLDWFDYNCQFPFNNPDCTDYYSYDDSIYLCLSSSSIPFSISDMRETYNITSDNFCITNDTYYYDTYFYTSIPNFNIIYSKSPITYISTPEWWIDWDSSWTLLPNWTDDLKWIVDGLKSTMAEFVPYIVYIGLWIIVAILWFVAIRWLVNWVRAKIFDNF